MIAIPNMSKPKDCYECPIAKSYLDCLMEKKYVCPIGHTDDCPLIEMGDIEYQAYKQISTTLLKRIEERILYGERRADEGINE